MKRILCYSLICLTAGALVSCKKWLDVKPQDKFTEVQVFANKDNLHQAFNGIYLQMSKSALYGANLTMLLPELLAQNYNIPANHSYYQYAQYNFADAGVSSRLDNIWSSAYVTIANINSFISKLSNTKGVITTAQDSVLRGEAVGLRAFLHFDLLRLFGPMYNTADSILPSIPYYRTISTTINPYLTAKDAMDSISADLQMAEGLLQNDPVITYGVPGDPGLNADPFYKSRNYRMNYYAVKALQARVNLYRGAKAAAWDAAQLVINNAQNFFPWIVPTNVVSSKDNPDRAFSTEMIFTVQSLDLYSNYNSYYAPTLSDLGILAPIDTRLKTMMEEATYPNDYRLNPSWIYPSASSKSYRTFYKFADMASPTISYRYRMPFLRISDMYYIAAECAPDNTSAIGLINKLRFNRAIPNLTLM